MDSNSLRIFYCINNNINILTNHLTLSENSSSVYFQYKMASIQQVFMNAIFYELSAISEYDALVDYVSEDDKVKPI